MAKKPTKKSVPARNPAPLVYPIANTAIKPEQLYELPDPQAEDRRTVAERGREDRLDR